MKKVKYGFTGISLTACLFFACSDMNDVHQQYLDQGERIYATKVDSVQVRPGDGRIRLDLFYKTQRIKACTVYWNGRTDSLKTGLPEPADGPAPVMLKDMEENSYSFEIVTFDKDDNRSLSVEAVGEVYGDSYKSSLLNIKIAGARMAGPDAEIAWEETDSESGICGVQVRYKNVPGGEKDTVISITPGTGAWSVLPGYLPGSAFAYRTLFKPDTMAIDTFYTDFETGTEIDVNSVLLKNYALPIDFDPGDAVPAAGNSLQ